jgi:hypothetical protein
MTDSNASERVRSAVHGSSSVALAVWTPAALMCAGLLVIGVHTAQAGINVWTNLGPPGGEVHALVVDPTRPGTLYCAPRGSSRR